MYVQLKYTQNLTDDPDDPDRTVIWVQGDTGADYMVVGVHDYDDTAYVKLTFNEARELAHEILVIVNRINPRGTSRVMLLDQWYKAGLTGYMPDSRNFSSGGGA